MTGGVGSVTIPYYTPQKQMRQMRAAYEVEVYYRVKIRGRTGFAICNYAKTQRVQYTRLRYPLCRRQQQRRSP